MGVFMLGLPAGVFLAYVTAGAIATKFGWRAAFCAIDSNWPSANAQPAGAVVPAKTLISPRNG